MNYGIVWIVIASWAIPFTSSIHIEDPRPELRHDQTQEQLHQTVFQPIGTYATNVLFTHAVLPVDIHLVLRSFSMARNTFTAVWQQAQDSAFRKNIEDLNYSMVPDVGHEDIFAYDVSCNRRQTPLHIKTGQQFKLQPGMQNLPSRSQDLC